MNQVPAPRSACLVLPGLLIAAMAACSYEAPIPDRVVACGEGQPSCPAGYRCAPLAPDSMLQVCTTMMSATPDGAAPALDAPGAVDTSGASEAAAPPPSPPNVDADADPSAAREDAAGDAIGPDAVMPPPDTMPEPADAPGAGDAEASRQCQQGTGGPVMVPAGDKFCIDSTEVTNAQYRKFLATVVKSKLTLPAECAANDTLVPDSTEEVIWSDARPDNLPVVNVDWCDAAAFCQWAGKRLCGRIGAGTLTIDQSFEPTVSQWVYACSHDATRLYPYGGAKDGECNVKKPRLPPAFVDVKSYPRCEGGYPGLFDMVGNVEEWIDACVPSQEKGGDCAVAGGGYAPEDADPICTSIFPGHRLISYHRRGFRCCEKN